ncbi:hypothetical protein BIV57_16825 [Mangrovactinospora gilvigrisea]|uniref:Subtilisin inhibitor domain-containing protein n=1 Tax=Mangrovactinospora gilvigrisea TaxID=1428644 RepID=A0A1J7BCJ7_9ACTN|nr:hypothetical protein BIV57_16825 [Mangrovactinospora gilvigrisea]
MGAVLLAVTGATAAAAAAPLPSPPPPMGAGSSELLPVPVSPGPFSPGPSGDTGQLQLSEQGASGGAVPVSAVVLSCPAGGAETHPHAAQACAALGRADGDPAKLPGSDRICPMIYQPVTAQVAGVWGGKRVDFRHDYANACVMKAKLAPVFDY